MWEWDTSGPINVRAAQEALDFSGYGVTLGAVDGEWGPQSRRALELWQRGATPYRGTPDGLWGPLTAEAMEVCFGWNYRLSEHFHAREFAAIDTGEVWVLRGLVDGLEALRRLTGEPLPIVSGCRTIGHNADVGGASSSQHLGGAAADIPARHSADEVVPLGVFSGLGVDSSNDRVIHVDVRHLGDNTTGSSPESPAVWLY